MNKHPEFAKDEEDDERGSGGKRGGVGYRVHDDRLGPAQDADLSEGALRQQLGSLKEAHKDLVHKQRQLFEERKIKQDTLTQEAGQKSRLGQGGGRGGQMPPHPLLSKKAQFDGVDKQVSPKTDMGQTNANLEKQEQLENKLENQLQNQLRNTPKPTSAPRLIR